MIFEGERIKVFSDTNVDAYLRYFRQRGFSCRLEDNEIVIGKKVVWHYDSEKLGNLIYSKRRAKEMTRGQFAEIMEVTPNSVFTWEIGRFVPREYYLTKIQEILDISEGELEECRI